MLPLCFFHSSLFGADLNSDDQLTKEEVVVEPEEIEEIVPSLPFHVAKDLSAFLLKSKDVARKGGSILFLLDYLGGGRSFNPHFFFLSFFLLRLLLGDKGSTTYHLHELLKGSEMVFPKPKKAPRVCTPFPPYADHKIACLLLLLVGSQN